MEQIRKKKCQDSNAYDKGRSIISQPFTGSKQRFQHDEVENFDYDMLVFFSPSGIDSLMKNFPDFPVSHKDVAIATFGPATANAAVPQIYPPIGARPPPGFLMRLPTIISAPTFDGSMRSTNSP